MIASQENAQLFLLDLMIMKTVKSVVKISGQFRKEGFNLLFYR